MAARPDAHNINYSGADLDGSTGRRGDVMTDKELLELAAEAAGIEEAKLRIEFNQWNPLTDDGDALRLAVRLGLQIRQYPIYDTPRFAVLAYETKWDSDAQRSIGAESLVNYDGDPYAATRRAITRAAAEIGRNMK